MIIVWNYGTVGQFHEAIGFGVWNWSGGTVVDTSVPAFTPRARIPGASSGRQKIPGATTKRSRIPGATAGWMAEELSEANAYEGLYAGRPYTTQAAWQAHVERWNDLIEDQAGLAADDLEYLDTEGLDYYATINADGVLDLADRDYWLDHELKRQGMVGEDGRLTFGEFDGTAPYYGSDPLGVGDTFIAIIDPLNPEARIIVKNTNDVTDQNGVTVLPDLWTGNTAAASDQVYQHRLWFNLESLHERNLQSSTVRRFRLDGGENIIYLRGGDYELTQIENFNLAALSFVDNFSDNGFASPSRIVIRNYPGETVNIYMGSGEWPDGTFGQIQMVDVYRTNFQFIGINFYGYLGEEGNRIFANHMFRGQSVATGLKFLHCAFRLNHGIGVDHPDAADFPHLVDRGYDNRKATSAGAPIDEEDLIYRMILANANDMEIRGCYFEPNASTDTAVNGDHKGETVEISGGTGTMILANRFAGLAPHTQLTFPPAASDAVVKGNDLENYYNTCINLGGGSGHVIEWNRIHSYGTSETDSEANGIQAGGTDLVIRGNVIYNHLPQAPPVGPPAVESYGLYLICTPNGGIGITDCVVEDNIFYRCGVVLGYSGSTLGSTDQITGNVIRRNIFIDRPTTNVADQDGNPENDAPLRTKIRTTERALNSITGNIFARDQRTPDPDDLNNTMMKVGIPGDSIPVTVTTVFDGWTLNTKEAEEDLFVGTMPDCGDFTPKPGGPADGFLENEERILLAPEDAPFFGE